MWTSRSGFDSAFNFFAIMSIAGVIGSLAGVIYLIYWLFTHVQVV